MIEEIKTKPRPQIDSYPKVLNNLVDKMLSIELTSRASIEKILESLDFSYYFEEQIIEALK